MCLFYCGVSLSEVELMIWYKSIILNHFQEPNSPSVFLHVNMDCVCFRVLIHHRSPYKSECSVGCVCSGTDFKYHFLVGRWPPPKATKLCEYENRVGNLETGHVGHHFFSEYWHHLRGNGGFSFLMRKLNLRSRPRNNFLELLQMMKWPITGILVMGIFRFVYSKRRFICESSLVTLWL
jgi:hypothetical protein